MNMSVLIASIFCMCIAVVTSHETIGKTFDLTADVNDEWLHTRSEAAIATDFAIRYPGIWFDNDDYTTEWLDGAQGRTTGDLENQRRWINYAGSSYNANEGECKVWCSTALAMKWEFVKFDKSPLDVNPTDKSLTDEELTDCTVLKAEDMLNEKSNGESNKWRGFNCYNLDQKESNCTNNKCIKIKAKPGMETKQSRKRDEHTSCDLCPNVRVKYLCSTKKSVALAGTLGTCPVWEEAVVYPTEEKRTIEDELQEQAFKLEQKERDILQERDALEMRQMEYREAKEVQKEKNVDSTQTRLINLLKKYLDN